MILKIHNSDQNTRLEEIRPSHGKTRDNEIVTRGADRRTPSSVTIPFGPIAPTDLIDEWELPCRVQTRDQVADQLVVKARDDANSVQTERKRIREEACRTRLFKSASSGRVESLTGSIVRSLLRLVEQFVIDNEIQDVALAEYLDQRQVPRHGHDKTIYTRVVRCVGKQLGRSLRNKIADNIAGARLLGIRSDDLHQAIVKGVRITSEGDIKHGVSALGEAYRNRLTPDSSVAENDEQGENDRRDYKDQPSHPPAEADAGLCMRTSETLMHISSSQRVMLRVSVGRGREIRVRRVRNHGNRIVLVVAPHDLRHHRSTTTAEADAL